MAEIKRRRVLWTSTWEALFAVVAASSNGLIAHLLRLSVPPQLFLVMFVGFFAGGLIVRPRRYSWQQRLVAALLGNALFVLMWGVVTVIGAS